MSKIDEYGSLYGQHSRWGVYNSDGLCPTLPAAMGMGGYTPCVVEKDEREILQSSLGYIDRKSKYC